jgi:Cu-Zn family superoxide dismutase
MGTRWKLRRLHLQKPRGPSQPEQVEAPAVVRDTVVEETMKRSSVRLFVGAASAMCLATGVAAAQQVTINKVSAQGIGEKIGTIDVSQSKKGVVFKVNVTGISAGKHGFHLHEKGDCGVASKDGAPVAGLAAGPHYDPAATKSHKGPAGMGHQGDLPVLTATAKGISQTVTAPRLKLGDVQGRSLVIHEGGDNYSDTPENGGGKGRIACGVVPKG